MALPDWCTATDARWPWPEPAGPRAFVQITFDAGQLPADAPASKEGPALPDPLRHAVAKRRAEYLAGRLAAGQALTRLGAGTACPERHPDGQPLWPAGFTGSITHSGSCAAVVVARTSDYLALGLDLEPLMADQAAQRLHTRILTPDERNRFQTALATQPGELITTAFSLKESLFKALFPATGCRFWFQDAQVVALQSDSARLQLNKTLAPQYPAGRQFEASITHTGHGILTMISLHAR
jgi:enterobactin synthetase component D